MDEVPDATALYMYMYCERKEQNCSNQADLGDAMRLARVNSEIGTNQRTQPTATKSDTDDQRAAGGLRVPDMSLTG